MRILVADDDSTFRNLTVDTLRERTQHEVLVAADGAKALQLALGTPTPGLLILDWLMPQLNGAQVCRLVRAAKLEVQPHILFLTARTRREEVIECLMAGADDLLSKPIPPDVLLARVQIAARRTEGPLDSTDAVRRSLVAAQREGDGELVVRSGELCARVLFSQGKLAWAHLADGSGSLFDVLSPEGGIDTQTARLVVEECRSTGASLGDTLAAWGLVDRARLRQAMQKWIHGKIAAICGLPEPRTLFIPQKHRGSIELLFELKDVAEWAVDSGIPIPLETFAPERPTLIPRGGWDAAFRTSANVSPEVDSFLNRCLSGDGVLGAAIIDRLSGVCLGRRGAELDPDVVWAQLRTVNAIMVRDFVEDSIVVTTSRIYLLAVSKAHPDSLAFAAVDPSKALLAAARMALRQAVEAWR